jgi:ATP-dependent Clp protease ATP-binding subunit ClpA
VFERCNENTTTIVDTAIAEAKQLRHNYLGTEHLLLAFTRHRDLLPDDVAALLPTTREVRDLLVGEIGTPRQHDAELLRTVGVDLDDVRAAVRRTFGDRAVEELGRRRVRQPWQPWRRPARRCTSLLAGTMSVAPRVKQAFEHARKAADRTTGAVRPTELLLGMIDVEDAMSNRMLSAAGVDPSTLRRLLAS